VEAAEKSVTWFRFTPVTSAQEFEINASLYWDPIALTVVL
jgi:hypothetical protein